MKQSSLARYTLPALAATLLASCTSVPLPPQPPLSRAPAPEPAPPVARQAEPPAPAPTRRESAARDARSYRQDAASHIYSMNQPRIWKGRLPPMLYAIGVLQVEVDGRGEVQKLNWMRAPTHAPEVIQEIERTVRAAAPFPVPARMGKVVYTDTWLWHQSGQFQLDTLTEGQD